MIERLALTRSSIQFPNKKYALDSYSGYVVITQNSSNHVTNGI